MLPHSSHWRFAFERDPEKEGRLLGFAGTPDNTTPPDEAEEQPENVDPTKASAEKVADRIVGKVQDARSKTQKVIDGDAPLVDDAASADEMSQENAGRPAQEKGTSRESDTKREKLEKTLAAARAQLQTISVLRTRMNKKAILEQLKTKASPELQAKWEKDLRALEREGGLIGQEILFAEGVQSFWEGDETPHTFLEKHREYMKNLPLGFGTLGNVIHETAADMGPMGRTAGMTEDEWKAGNASQRIETIESFLDHIQIDAWLGAMEAQYGKMAKILKKQDQWIEEIEKQATSLIIAEKNPETGGVWRALAKTRFYSINNYIHGIQAYWTALKKTMEDRNERYSADIARKLGRAMQHFDFWPLYGTEVEQILSQQLDAKSNEETEAMKKSLESDNTKWEGLFARPGGEYWKYAGKNPNKTRGVLEYAAEKGFLYDIDEDLHNPAHPIYGRKLTEICSDWEDAGDHQKTQDYFTSLRGKNAAGREHEIEHGFKMEFDVENVPRFIELLEHELDEHNLWAAAGICKRAMQRGLRGEISAWLLTTIMQKLRQHPDLRNNVPVEFFDIVGKESMYTTAFTLGWAKGYRNELALWAKTGDESILESNELKELSVIERDVIAKDSRGAEYFETKKGKKDMNLIVARVLAGQIVELDRGHIHIFQSKFNGYRKGVLTMFADAAKPLQEDADYAREDTEKIMLPDVTFSKILGFKSTNDFENETWAAGFFNSMITMAQRLEAIPELKEAYDNYRYETKKKFNKHFGGFLKRTEAGQRQLSTTIPPDGKSAIATLIVEGLLDWEVMEKASYVETLKEVLNRDYPNFLATVPQKPTGGAGAASKTTQAA